MILLVALSSCTGAARREAPPAMPFSEPEVAESAPDPPAAEEFADAPLDCQRDAALRARAPGAFAEGKLDRARRLIELSNRLCREHAAQSWTQEMQVLWELGRVADARRLAAIVLVEPEADAAARQLAGELRARPEPKREAPEQLLKAALAQSDPAAMQRLLDRARSALERELGEPARLVVPRPKAQWLAAAFSRDAARAALAAQDGTLRVVELGSEPHSRALPALPHANLIRLAFSPDGSTLAASANRSTVYHHLDAGKQEQSSDSGWTSWMEFRDARTVLAVESDGGNAWAAVRRVGSRERGKSISLECYSEPIAALDGGRELACRAADGVTHRPGVVIYDVNSKKRLRFLDFPKNRGMSWLIAMENPNVFVAGGFGSLLVIDQKTGALRGELSGYSGRTRGFATQGNRLLLGGGEPSGQLALYDVPRVLAGAADARAEAPQLEGPPLIAVAFRGETIVSIAADGVISERGPDLRETLRLVPAGDDFVVVAPGGEADVPPGALSSVRCQIGEQSFDVALCRERFIVPHLQEALSSGRAYDP